MFRRSDFLAAVTSWPVLVQAVAEASSSPFSHPPSSNPTPMAPEASMKLRRRSAQLAVMAPLVRVLGLERDDGEG